jgi:cytochrome c biogenesis protein CcmG/thiol:disulfide interchange protein DsbE
MSVASDFTVATFSGEEFTLSANRGRPVVVNFWASWCGPCRFEAPTLRKAYEEYSPRGVAFIGVAVQDTDERAKGFVEKYGLTFPNGRDSTGEIMKTYEIYAIPQTFVIGRDGRISYVHTGPVTDELLASEIEKAL